MGLSPEFMNSSTEGYCTIGYSTKRERQDQIGYYGFGRLVSLSYTNQYWVHTVYQGVAYEYLIFLDGNTIKQTLLKQEKTTEPSGTRVVVQLKKEWYEKNKWISAIKEQAAYFEGTIINEQVCGIDKKVEVEKKGLIRKSNLYSETTHLVLGSVNYTIPWDKFPEWDFLKHLNFGIYVGLDEGLVPTPSRETFIYNDFSIQLLTSKFQKIAEDLYQDCNKILEEVGKEKDIVKLKFNYEGIVGDVTLDNYNKICKVLNKPKVELLDECYTKHSYPNSIYTTIRDSFKTKGTNPYYSENWTTLKKLYVNNNFVWKVRNPSLKWLVYVDTTHLEEKEKKDYESEQLALIESRLVREYIEEYFLPFDEQGYEQWKKERKKERVKKEKVQGLSYYRAHTYDGNLCVEDKDNFDLREYHYLFKATKQTANKYWKFLNSLNLSGKMLITKSHGYDLDKLEPSPFLKRLCSEALKSQVASILGKDISSKYVLELIKELNPLLHQYILDTKLEQVQHRENTDEIKALVESGELLGCFDKDEVKLRYIQHHLNKLRLINYIGTASGYPYYAKQFTEDEKSLIKRMYILERLVEKKEEVIVEDVNQLQLELN